MMQSLGFLFLVSSVLLVTQAQSFSLGNLKLSEDNMFENDNKKEVKFLKRVLPSISIKPIGQVGGIDTDLDGKLIVFHRGSRRWTFEKNNFNVKKYGPIPEKVLSLIDTKRSKTIESWGSNKFYMPHGLTVDFEGNIWLTDVGLHQVFKFNFHESEEPALILGVEFNNGNDENHFCKPTDVAVSSLNGDVFVSDGYCNQRVVQFDKNGNYIKEFKDAESPLNIAHSIALIEPLSMVCTVSRQEGRIVCFDIKSGNKKYEITDPSMLTVYAIRYDEENNVLHAATGDNKQAEAVGLTFDASKEGFGKLLQKWNGEDRDMKEVHDIVTSPEGSRLFLGSLNGEIDEFTYE